MLRQTRSGDVLLEFVKNSRNRIGFAGELKKILGELGTVRNFELKLTLEIGYLDSCTMVPVVEEAIKKHVGISATNKQWLGTRRYPVRNLKDCTLTLSALSEYVQ